MIAPLGAPDLSEAVRAGSEVYAALRRRLADAGHATGLGDEGGFAPALHRPEQALSLIAAAIKDAGYTPGRDGVSIALDAAASEFRSPDGTYLLDGEALTSSDMIAMYEQLVADFPIWSIEDGLGEDDRDGWITLTAALGDRTQLVGDDNLTTSPLTPTLTCPTEWPETVAPACPFPEDRRDEPPVRCEEGRTARCPGRRIGPVPPPNSSTTRLRRGARGHRHARRADGDPPQAPEAGLPQALTQVGPTAVKQPRVPL